MGLANAINREAGHHLVKARKCQAVSGISLFSWQSGTTPLVVSVDAGNRADGGQVGQLLRRRAVNTEGEICHFIGDNLQGCSPPLNSSFNHLICSRFT